MSRPKNKFRKIYGNWKVHHPDGTLIFRCDDAKANWYLSRDLAEIIAEDTIKLKFIPQGRGHEGDKFYLSERKNLCVCCKSKLELTRHHVVPYCYRRHFPDELKNYTSHDIVALCRSCHGKYEKLANLLKAQLAKEANVVLDELIPDTKFEPYELDAICAAGTLQRHSAVIPVDRKEFLLAKIRAYFTEGEITPEVIEELANRPRKKKINKDKGKKIYGGALVEKLDDIKKFVQLWRKHFIDTMQPQYLPDGWDIDRELRSA